MGGRAATEAIIRGRCAISVNDPEHPTPRGWLRVSLSEVAELGTGHTPSRKHPEYWGGDVPWIGIRDAGAHHGGVITHTAQHTNSLGLANSAARLLPEGTVCLSRTASVGYVVVMGCPMATSQDFVTWTCSEALEPKFLVQALLAEGDDIRRFGEGSTHTTIYFPEVKAFHLDMPPKAEQQRIVAKIDGLSAKSSRARDHLDHIPRLIEKYKQAVLTSVFSSVSELGSLAPLAELANVVTSGSRDWSQYYDRGSSVFVLAGNVRPMEFDPQPKRFVDPPLDGPDARRSRIRENDLLITIVGAGTGDLCRVPKQYDNYFVCQSVALIRLRRPETARLIELFLNAEELGLAQIRKATYGQGRPHLSFVDLRNLLIPALSAKEANRVVRLIEKAFGWIDRLAAEATSARRLVDRLDQAVLVKAFRGELVPHDPADEPASVLLERIRAERTGEPRAKRGRKRADAAA